MAERNLFEKLNSLSVLGIVLFVFSASFPPFDILTQTNLAAHMGQHALIALSGVMIAYPFYLKARSKGLVPSRSYAILGIFAIIVLVVFWHLPETWDAAVLNPLVHAVEHMSFLAVGMLIGWYFPALPDNLKFMSVFLAASGHMVYGIFLLIMNTPVYPLYTVSQQTLLGYFMLLPSPFYFVGMISYSLHRETERLEQLEFSSKPDLFPAHHHAALRTDVFAIPAAVSHLAEYWGCGGIL